jgi:hypothetical protein
MFDRSGKPVSRLDYLIDRKIGAISDYNRELGELESQALDPESLQYSKHQLHSMFAHDIARLDFEIDIEKMFNNF